MLANTRYSARLFVTYSAKVALTMGVFMSVSKVVFKLLFLASLSIQTSWDSKLVCQPPSRLYAGYHYVRRDGEVVWPRNTKLGIKV